MRVHHVRIAGQKGAGHHIGSANPGERGNCFISGHNDIYGEIFRHLDEVKMGDEIGRTSNTGKMGKRVRRNALHFAVLYSEHPEWSNDGMVVTPKDGYFMDPNAFYRSDPPYDSPSLVKLSRNQKRVPVPYKKADGTFVPSDTKRIWPYVCK